MENKNPQATPPRVVYIIQQPQEEEFEEDGSPGWVWAVFFFLILLALGTVILAGSPDILISLKPYLTEVMTLLK
jgi:hypothetical protein